MQTKKLISLFLVISLLSPTQAQAYAMCSEVYSRNGDIFSPTYPLYLQDKFGGLESQWTRIVENLLRTKSPEDLVLIENILRDGEVRNWFQKKSNIVMFFRVEAMARTLDHVLVRQFDLSKLKDWNELTLSERRALLLQGFRKWWWQVDSHFVMGFSRWSDVTYIVSRFINEPISKGRLDLRLHELLGTTTQTGVLSHIMEHFRAEYRIFETLKEQPESYDLIKSTLEYRVEFLRKTKEQFQLNKFQQHLFDLNILKNAVLLRMLELNRSLTIKEINELAESIGVPKFITAEVRGVEFLFSVLPSAKTWGSVIQFTAVNVGLSLIMALIYGSQQEREGHYKGKARDLFPSSTVDPIQVGD